MRFGRVPLADAAGAIAAHAVRFGDRTVHKGTVVTPALLADLSDAGVDAIVVAILEPGDVAENEVAERIARLIGGGHLELRGPVNGRADLVSGATGIVILDRDVVDRVNLAQEAIQVATLPAFAVAEAGQIVATVKVIPFGVAAETLAAAENAIAAPALRLAPFVLSRIGVVATQAPHLKPSVLDKTRRVLDRRLQPLGARVTAEERTEHDAEAIGQALAKLGRDGLDLLLVFGASATSDAADTVPAGIEAAGGRVLRIGMPVDPGNLLVLGELHGVPVIGAPGCARSPAASGFDWVLQRLLAGIPVTSADIAKMGAGGVLATERHRPFHASQPSGSPRVDAVILAAGESSRMNGRHKLLARFGGRPLVRLVAEEALSSAVAEVIVVVGHRAAEMRAALEGLDIRIVENRDYRAGLSSSLRAGIAALPSEADGAVVLLADMPDVRAAVIDALVAAYDPDSGAHIIAPTHEGRQGNPVLWSRRFFADLMAIQGDTGARDLIRAKAGAVTWIEAGSAVTHDVDTPEELSAASGTWA